MSIAALVAGNPLRAGATGPAVVALQKALAARSYPLLGTGYLGPKTKEGVATDQQVRGLRSTGVVDLTTAVSLDQPTPAAPPPKADVPPWVATAIQSIGVAEAPGAKDNPVVIAMAKLCGGKIAKTYTHDSIAWCKMFTEYCLVKNGLRGVDSLWALDNAKLGTKLKGAAVGAIASKKRTGGDTRLSSSARTKPATSSVLVATKTIASRGRRSHHRWSFLRIGQMATRCPPTPAFQCFPWSTALRFRSMRPDRLCGDQQKHGNKSQHVWVGQSAHG